MKCCWQFACSHSRDGERDATAIGGTRQHKHRIARRNTRHDFRIDLDTARNRAFGGRRRGRRAFGSPDLRDHFVDFAGFIAVGRQLLPQLAPARKRRVDVAALQQRRGRERQRLAIVRIDGERSGNQFFRLPYKLALLFHRGCVGPVRVKLRIIR